MQIGKADYYGGAFTARGDGCLNIMELSIRGYGKDTIPFILHLNIADSRGLLYNLYITRKEVGTMYVLADHGRSRWERIVHYITIKI